MVSFMKVAWLSYQIHLIIATALLAIVVYISTVVHSIVNFCNCKLRLPKSPHNQIHNSYVFMRLHVLFFVWAEAGLGVD